MTFHSRDSFRAREYRNVSFGRGKNRKDYIVLELEAECVRLGEINAISVAYRPVKKVMVDLKNPDTLERISNVLRVCDEVEYK